MRIGPIARSIGGLVPGLVAGLVAGLGWGCAVGSSSEDPFGSAVSVGHGSATGDSEPGAEGSGSGDGGATSVGQPPETGGPSESGDPPPPGAEICNGLDDDGDGSIDEDQPDQSCGMGSCAVTQPTCVQGESVPCTPALPGAEICNGLDDDCNGTVDDGPGQPCSTACGPGVLACVGGVEQACDAPPVLAESCNLDDDDCDGSTDEGVAGCRVGVHRSYHPTTEEHFYTTSLPEAQCCGFTLETSDFYHLYAGPHPGLTAFHRCIKASGLHFYTQSPTCEGQTLEGVMGYIATAAGVAGSVPLYRVYRPASTDHFYTTSAAERDAAVASLGYLDEGVAGYVW